MIRKCLARVPLSLGQRSIIEALKHAVMLHYPSNLVSNDGTKDFIRYLTVGVGSQNITDVMQQTSNDPIIIGSISLRTGGGLQHVLKPIHVVPAQPKSSSMAAECGLAMVLPFKLFNGEGRAKLTSEQRGLVLVVAVGSCRTMFFEKEKGSGAVLTDQSDDDRHYTSALGRACPEHVVAA